MPTKPKLTWIVIADGMHARVLRREHRGGPLLPALDREFVDPAVHGFARDMKSDRPGRAFDTGSGMRHAMEPRHDPHEYEKHRFARQIAALINAAAEQNAFQQLVVAAPPKVLGELRAELDHHARRLVIGEVPRDLIKTPLAELPSHLADVLPS